MRHVTLLAAFCGLLALAPAADAQGCDASDPAQAGFEAVDIREINAIPQDNIDVLNAAVADGSITMDMIQDELTGDFEGAVVEFEAVVLSDPNLSAVRTTVEGIPGGIHYFVRDLSAATDGAAGQGIQIADQRGNGESFSFRVGSVVTVCGRVSTYTGRGGKVVQIGGDSEIFSISQTDLLDPTDPANAALFDPVGVTTDDVHDTLSDGTTILDFDAYADYSGQYVRFEGITVVQGVQGDRPDVLLQSPTQDTQINLYDQSACFRNDRGEDYFRPGFAPDCIDTEFVPPPTGTADVQGFLIFQGDEGGFGYSAFNAANFVVNPYLDEDFFITEAPPTIAVDGPSGTPGPSDDVTITALIVPAQGTITTATIDYSYVKDGATLTSGMVTMTQGAGDEWSGVIPAYTADDANGAFVNYTVSATDSDGLSSTSDENSYLISSGTIDQISQIQTTPGGGFGDSPLLTGDPATFDLTATVQSVIKDGSFFLATIQDAAAPWSGIWITLGSDDRGLEVGDVINITEATIEERFDLTRLTDLTFTETGTATPFAPIVVETSALVSGGVYTDAAEAHEGVMIRIEDAEVVDLNPDAPSGPFGEFSISTSGPSAGLRVDDLSDADDGVSFPGGDPGAVYSVYNVLEFVQGPLFYSFDNYKITPQRAATDIGPVTNVSVEDTPGAGTARIDRVFPNPSAGVATVRFALDAAGDVSVRLFDVTGREVATLASGAMAAGTHTAELDVAALATGVYLVRLEADGGVDTARVSVVR